MAAAELRQKLGLTFFVGVGLICFISTAVSHAAIPRVGGSIRIEPAPRKHKGRAGLSSALANLVIAKGQAGLRFVEAN